MCGCANEDIIGNLMMPFFVLYAELLSEQIVS